MSKGMSRADLDAIAAFKGQVTRLPDGEARGADGRMSAGERAVREYMASMQGRVKPRNGSPSARRGGAVKQVGHHTFKL